MSRELLELTAPCHFGLESVLKREINELGYDVTEVDNGKVTFAGDAEAVAYSNVFLRTAERVLIRVGEFHAETFDELFEKTKALPWERFIPKNGKFWVAKANSVRSRLFSPSDIQSVMKKAIVERLSQCYHVNWFEEDGASYPVRVSIVNDVVTAGLDTSGISLHKRGYRTNTVKAPITETLAAALIMLTPWKKGRILVDPFCGSGTFCIEGAMIAADIAPGMKRTFLAETWDNAIDRKNWEYAREDAADRVTGIGDTVIQGFDIDDGAVSFARANAGNAGLDGMIHFQRRPVSELSHSGKYGFIITNPPYGERLEDKKNLPAIYSELGRRFFEKLPTWSLYVITSYDGAEHYIGRKAAKNRKVYNGMIKTYFYQYPGPRPDRKADT